MVSLVILDILIFVYWSQVLGYIAAILIALLSMHRLVLYLLLKQIGRTTLLPWRCLYFVRRRKRGLHKYRIALYYASRIGVLVSMVLLVSLGCFFLLKDLLE